MDDGERWNPGGENPVPDMMKTPVLLIVFNRPELTGRVFRRIREMAPRNLHVVADGPRRNSSEDVAKCAEARRIVSEVDWDCSVQYRFREENVGFIANIIDGVDWILSRHGRAMILEDDCLPAVSFGRFCDELLDRYENNDRLFMISGTNYLNCWSTSDASFHFSRFGGIWGWATWRRAWDRYQRKWNSEEAAALRKSINTASPAPANRRFLLDLLQKKLLGKADSWDYAWLFSMLYNEGLAVVPEYNLVENIGFGESATHTRYSNRHLDCLEAREMTLPLNPPGDVAPDREFDARLLKVLGFEQGAERNIFQRMKTFWGEELPWKWLGRAQWRDIEYFDNSWKDRIRRMAGNIPPNATVMDLGAGEMFLKEFVGPNHYFGADYIKRDPGIMVCDFNKYQFPSARTDVAFVSGCLEYVRDYRWFIGKIASSCNMAVVSYCTRDLLPDIEWRRKQAWRNHLKKRRLIELFEGNGMFLRKEEMTPTRNSIFVFQHE